MEETRTNITICIPYLGRGNRVLDSTTVSPVVMMYLGTSSICSIILLLDNFCILSVCIEVSGK